MIELTNARQRAKRKILQGRGPSALPRGASRLAYFELRHTAL